MNKKGLFLILGTAFVSGFAIFINKLGVSFSDPTVYTFLKNIFVAFLISGVIFYGSNFKKFKEIEKRDWIKLVAIGVLGGSLPFVLFFKGLSMTSAAQGAFIHKSMFILIAILAWGFLREKIRTSFLLGGSLLFLGNALFLKNLDVVFSRGDFLIFLATLFWAIENIISKKILSKVDWKIVVWSRMTFGSLLVLSYVAFSQGLSVIQFESKEQIFWMIISGLFLFAYQATWYGGLKYVPVSAASAVLLLGSAVTTFLGFVQRGQIEFQSAFGSFLIILGVSTIVFSEKINKKIKKIIHHVRN